MVTSPILSLFEPINPLRLAGPLLDRELRVSSRRRRTYLLRIGYVALMGAFALAAWCWIMLGPKPGTTLFGMSRSARAGIQIAHNILWFQFFAAQLVTVVMMSSSMDSEMRRGGLDVLLTTPITSVQIVLGKLLSRSWQILLLMALSLPALAVVRVVGGISWGLVVSSFTVTLTSVLFVGALCLWLSTYCRHSYQVVSAAVLIYLIAFIALPGVVTLVVSLGRLNEGVAGSIVRLLSPRQAFNACLEQAWQGRMRTPKYFFFWPLHCLIMFDMTLVLLGLCARRIRFAAGRLHAAVDRPTRRRGPLRHCPIVWRERREDASRFGWRNLLLITVAAVLCCLIVVVRVTRGRAFALYSGTRDMVWAFRMVALLRLAVFAAGAITREKESGTWASLLATPLDDRQIVRGKLRTVVDRSLPWILAALAVEVCLSLCTAVPGYRIWVIAYALSYCTSAFFVAATGLFLGLRLRTTVAAVATTLGLEMLLRYMVAGAQNPAYVWLRYRILAAYPNNATPLMLFGLAIWLGMMVLHAVLGVLLLRRTRMTLRCGV